MDIAPIERSARRGVGLSRDLIIPREKIVLPFADKNPPRDSEILSSLVLIPLPGDTGTIRLARRHIREGGVR